MPEKVEAWKVARRSGKEDLYFSKEEALKEELIPVIDEAIWGSFSPFIGAGADSSCYSIVNNLKRSREFAERMLVVISIAEKTLKI